MKIYLLEYNEYGDYGESSHIECAYYLKEEAESVVEYHNSLTNTINLKISKETDVMACSVETLEYELDKIGWYINSYYSIHEIEVN